MRDHRLHHLTRVTWRIRDIVHDAVRKAGLLQRLRYEPMRCRTEFGAFQTTVLPQASGAATARTPRMTGAFHGAIPSTTPAGCRIAIASEPGTSEGMISPLICVVMAAASNSIPAARYTLKPAHRPEPPVSAAMAVAKAGAFASSACAAFSSSSRRRDGPVADHDGKARAAASTAAMASARLAAGARVATEP